MSKPTESVSVLRKRAIRRLFEQKFLAPVRITVGSATCENAAGADAVYARFQELMAKHQPKGVVLGRVGCAGKCDMEPLVTVIARNGIPTKYIMMDAERATRVFESHILKGTPLPELSMCQVAGGMTAERVVSLCGGGACPQKMADDVRKAFRESLERHGLKEKVLLTESPCQGLCDNGPMAYVYPEGVMYEKLDAARVERITQEHLLRGKPVAEYAWDSDRISNRFFPLFGDIHFFGNQLRLTLRNCGVIDPESLDEYLAVRGYEASAKVLETMTAAQVVNAMKQSGLRGRGGGGFPTGLKWQMALDQPGLEKYIICNADEGDPGAFMDRSTIEGDPHTILEGMIIGGYAIGATKGFIYIRAEYPLAIKRLEKALDDARQAGFLGTQVFGSSFNFDIEIRLGAGAFVCGEETALINSIEGKRGMPRPRPPYPSVSGLWGKPTVINNVETFANVPVIILDGPAWFAAIGTPKSKGTKVFALAGDVANTGLIEVPMGTTLRDVVYGVGGGIKDGKRLKAVQTGGPAGGCMPESALDTPIDYDSLSAAGSIMGSGGMIVMDEDNCMVNVARFFIEFTQDESCGKCTPCREGTKRMLEILTRITEGKGVEGDVEKLLRLADTVKRSSLCGLGQAAPNPVLSTIRHFRAEYDSHIRDKHCSTGACRNLVRYLIVPEKCVGCGACKRNCPVECISGEVRKPHTIDQERCVKCGRCFDVCKFDAVKRT
jgi:NADH:ubiquinone oxidoreductase subunit F (NADH-binding)/(2Fe-2S) ferredoxin/NAD-dependent dihydropyrimidine dehydrogenase PreA subunit